MKNKLLFSILVLFCFFNADAQTKVWNFLTNSTILPAGFTGVPGGTEDIVDDLGRFAHITSNNFSSQSSGASTFSDGFTSNVRANMNGGSVPEGFLPTMRFYFFDVDANCTIKVWARAQSTSERTLNISDGENLIATSSQTSGAFILEGANTNGAKRIFIYCEAGGFGIYKIEVNGANVNTTIPMSEWLLLSTDEMHTSKFEYYIQNKTVYLKNISNVEEAFVFSLTGSLVKSVKNNSFDELNFDVQQSGIYLLTLKTKEGFQSVKISIK